MGDERAAAGVRAGNYHATFGNGGECMADGIERVAKFRDAALVLTDDANMAAVAVRKHIRRGDYQKAESAAAELQRAARDVKWLMRRQPKN
jgi:hypothetical protein